MRDAPASGPSLNASLNTPLGGTKMHQLLRSSLVTAAVLLGLVEIGPSIAETVVPLPHAAIRAAFSNHSYSSGGAIIYWAPDGTLRGSTPKATARGTWSAALGKLCYGATWWQSEPPRASTSSQGGGFEEPFQTHDCLAINVSGNSVVAELLRSPSDRTFGLWPEGRFDLPTLSPGE